jgi:SAM-dependent methyltransferase
MSLLSMADTLPLLVCPRCRSSLVRRGERLVCSGDGCPLRETGFAFVAHQPVLIDHARSVVASAPVAAGGAPDHAAPAATVSPLRRWARRITTPHNRVAAKAAARMAAELRRVGGRPRLLVIGGATVGNGAESLYQDPGLDLVAFDLRPTPFTQFVADGHAIPLADGSVAGVWIQAVLEHVLDPAAVVAEIHRVLAEGGVVYAETPFLQAVHEGAHDFTRFTESGHRWLFRRFAALDRGVVAGPGIALAWAIDRAVRGLFRSELAGRLAWLAMFWVRWLDRWIPAPYAIDSASCVFFLGRKSDRAMAPAEIVGDYRGAQCAR